ncbi:MAG: superoxide dismutase family protein [Parachlamydia sp.]|nr:superoxide dismutase family protein [Parachlamydia sp.]
MYKKSLSQLLATALLIGSFSSCVCTDTKKMGANASKNNEEIADAGKIEANMSKKAVAHIKAFQGNHIHGTILFTQEDEGVRIVANIEGLTPGKHGFHIHEFGDCKDSESVGDHYNPSKKKHGGPDSAERHVGDLGNLVADKGGRATYNRVDKVIKLQGEQSIIGHSVVIHSHEDDFVTQPTGASGAKIACGVIEAEQI